MMAQTVKLVLTLLLLPALPPAPAKTIYQFTDEQGILHFTDREPDTDRPVETRRVYVDTKAGIRIHSEKKDGYHSQVVKNLLHGPVQVLLQLGEGSNIRIRPSLPRDYVLEAGFEGELVRIMPVDPQQNWSYRLVSQYIPGQPGAEPDRNHLYLPPIPAGKRFRVSQGFNGESTHNKPGSVYAIDIPMPVGTPIVAARDGVVMDVQQDYFGSGQDLERFGPRANAIRIHHADGTMAVYAHLDVESAWVSPGDVVLAGEVIGLSGNTGYTTGPHLHFVIQRNAGMRLESVPFRFRDNEDRLIEPRTGTVLTGVNIR